MFIYKITIVYIHTCAKARNNRNKKRKRDDTIEFSMYTSEKIDSEFWKRNIKRGMGTAILYAMPCRGILVYTGSRNQIPPPPQPFTTPTTGEARRWGNV